MIHARCGTRDEVARRHPSTEQVPGLYQEATGSRRLPRIFHRPCSWPYSTRWRNSQVAAESVTSAITASGQSSWSTIVAGMSFRNTPFTITMK